MTDKQVLEKAIQKAIDGGWGEPDLDPNLIADDCVAKIGGWNLRQVIFDHNFAKALWGEEYLEDFDYGDYPRWQGEQWQVCLEQMVIAEDPIAYLGENM